MSDPDEGRVEPASALAGVPDEFQRLWTPHRMAYIQAGPEPLKHDCPFCAAPGKSDEEGLIVARGPAIVSKAALVFDASVDQPAEKAAKHTQLATAGVVPRDTA